MRQPEVTDDLATRLKARADDLAIALPHPSDDGNLHAYPILPPAWCRATRADLIAAAAEIAAMTAALVVAVKWCPGCRGRGVLVGRESGGADYRDDCPRCEPIRKALGRVGPPAGADGRGEGSEADA